MIAIFPFHSYRWKPLFVCLNIVFLAFELWGIYLFSERLSVEPFNGIYFRVWFAIGLLCITLLINYMLYSICELCLRIAYGKKKMKAQVREYIPGEHEVESNENRERLACAPVLSVEEQRLFLLKFGDFYAFEKKMSYKNHIARKEQRKKISHQPTFEEVLERAQVLAKDGSMYCSTNAVTLKLDENKREALVRAYSDFEEILNKIKRFKKNGTWY